MKQPDKARQTVLVVDDQPFNRDICVEILSTEYEILEGANGREAVDIAIAKLPDVILIDLMMPVMDGMKAIRELKANPRTGDIPVIIMSALGVTEDIVQGLEFAEDYIVKPFEVRELVARVRTAARLKAAQDQTKKVNQHLEQLVNKRTEQLLEQEKLSIVGQFAAGIVHNLSGALQKVMGSLELAQIDTDSRDDYLKTALGSSLEMRQIISTILDKGRNEQRLDKIELNLNELIASSLSFWEADRYFKHEVEKKLELADDMPPLFVVHAHWSQSIDNLIKNALEAMQGSDRRLLSITTQYADGHIELTVSDTGSGMDEKTLNNLFDPFYSTKKDGGGTGLGLTSLKALLDPYRVEIKVNSTPGRGSSFTLIINPELVNAGGYQAPFENEPERASAAH